MQRRARSGIMYHCESTDTVLRLSGLILLHDLFKLLFLATF